MDGDTAGANRHHITDLRTDMSYMTHTLITDITDLRTDMCTSQT